MKKIILSIFLITSLCAISIAIVLSTTGYETDKFNQLISKKINENDNQISINLKKIKYKIDLKNLNFFLITNDPDLNFYNSDISLKNLKVYLDLFSLLKSKIKITKINVLTNELNIDQLKKIILKTKPSNLNSIITNKVNNGIIIINLELYMDDNFNIKNYVIKGKAKEISAIISKKINLKDTSFDFFADPVDILIKEIYSEVDGVKIKNGNLRVDKSKNINIQSDFNTEIDITKKNIKKYLPIIKDFNNINDNSLLKAKLDHILIINFDKTLKVINYDYTSKGTAQNISLKFDEPLENAIFDENIKELNLVNSVLNTRYSSNKKNFIEADGKYQFNKNKTQNYKFKNIFENGKMNIDLNLKFSQPFYVDLINYNQKINEVGEISLNFILNKDLINFKNIRYEKNKNLISVKDLKFNKNKFFSLNQIKVVTFNKSVLNNDFKIDFDKKIKISGNKFDATNLMKFIKKKSNNNSLKKIDKEIVINFKNVLTPLSEMLLDFRLIGKIEKGKFVKILSKGDFGDNNYLDITLKTDKKLKKKYLEIYSDLAKPLLTDYNFFNGLIGGKLMFSSILENNMSKSNLVINNFKIVDAPNLIKLLSLADFGGLADLAKGEGLTFDKMEIKMNSQNDFLRLEELYAVGPSISVLMEGYKESSGLVSLRGTLVPAKNLNKILSKIPIIGKIIIPKELGEGLFGISFKIKGPPGKVKTTINPIRTVTPRFIQKIIDKNKKSK